RAGDVVLYLGDDGYTVHRVVSPARRVSGGAFVLTEGDARFAPDPPVPCAKVVGTVVAVEISGRWQAPGPPRAHPLHKRVTRALTKVAMIAVMSVDVTSAGRLAALLIALESAARSTVRAAKREVRLSGIRLGFLLDQLRHPTVRYQRVNVGRI